MYTIEEILSDLQGHSGQEKTAQATPPNSTLGPAKTAASVDAASKGLSDVLDQILGTQTSKTASTHGADDVTSHMQKLAQDLADADTVSTVKEAQLYGAAVFDGFLSRANQYADAAPVTYDGYKTASAQDTERAEAVAAEYGYATARNALEKVASWVAAAQEQTTEKTAQEEMLRGVLAGLEKVAQFSEDCFLRGAEHVDTLISQ